MITSLGGKFILAILPHVLRIILINLSLTHIIIDIQIFFNRKNDGVKIQNHVQDLTAMDVVLCHACSCNSCFNPLVSIAIKWMSAGHIL